MCENEIKKGSNVILKCNIGCFLGYQIPEGTRGFVLENATSPFVEFDIKPNKFLHDGGGLGEEGKCWSVHINYLKLYEYKTSNRYKLKQAIKETGISSRKLSHFAMGNESFFYNQTGPARFKEYGDISSSKLDSMLVLLEVAKINLNAKITQDAFNEREKLDLAAKTADENNVPVIDKPIFNLDCGSSDIEDYQRLVKSKAIEKRDYRLRNFMIVFLILVIILAVYFFTR